MSLLAGIRVLDLSLQLPGPFCTLIMADHGADVIKVDEPDPRVRNPFAGREPGMSPMDRYLNRGKRSLTLNLKTDEGRAVFHALAERADVVVEGFRPGVVRRLGVDYEALSAINPRLVYCSISGYGQTGPLRETAGHDINYIARAGILGLCGGRGGDPAIPPVQIGDLFGGAMMALSGILMALLARQRSGTGRWVDVSMTDGAAAMLAIHSAIHLATGEIPERGNMMLTGRFPCYGVYRCGDGKHVCLGALEPWFWERLVTALEREDLRGGQVADGEEGDRVRRELGAIFATRSRDEWVRFFEGKDVCLAPVLDLPEALADPHLMERGMVIEVESPLGGTDRQAGNPLKFSSAGPAEAGEKPAPAPRRAPRLGEHDEEILREIGYGPERIARLRETGVIRVQ
ncbi:MAG: CaiB/BaiF CoA-transferase family protein [Deltaproteobacteria bacterium]